MWIVPAIDVKQGNVVRAVAGERMAYLPVRSEFSEHSTPEAIGTALIDEFALRQVYLADLDAIEGAEPDWELYVKLIDCGLELWIDAGLASSSHCEQMVEFSRHHPEVNGIIGGLESIADKAMVGKYLDLVGPEKFIFSLDLKDGHPLTQERSWQNRVAAEIASEVIDVGVTRMIVIDLAHVGMHGGWGTQKLCSLLHQQYPQLAIYAGGGLRSRDDLQNLADAGCEAALVSSALHDGWITRQDMAQFSELDESAGRLP